MKWSLCYKSTIKVIAALGSIGCFVLLFGFWHVFQTKYQRQMLCLLAPGYAALLIAFAIDVIINYEVDESLHRVFVMYGVAAYSGIAAICWLHCFSDLDDKAKIPPERLYCLAAGALALFQAFILFVDSVLCLLRVKPLPPRQTSSKRVLVGNVKSEPSKSSQPSLDKK